LENRGEEELEGVGEVGEKEGGIAKGVGRMGTGRGGGAACGVLMWEFTPLVFVFASGVNSLRSERYSAAAECDSLLLVWWSLESSCDSANEAGV
jgi:hypothetical protein